MAVVANLASHMLYAWGKNRHVVLLYPGAAQEIFVFEEKLMIHMHRTFGKERQRSLVEISVEKD